MAINNYPQRGEIYLISSGRKVSAGKRKLRPAVIISNDINNEAAQTITILPVTFSQEKVYPFEVLITSTEAGFSQKAKIKCNLIRTIHKMCLVEYHGKVSREELKSIENALQIHLFRSHEHSQQSY